MSHPATLRGATSWTPPRLLLAWLLPKALVIAVWLAFAHGVQGDVHYYFRSIEAMADKGPGQTLVEYPTPVIWLLQLPHLLSFGSPTVHLLAFVGCMLALDAWLMLSLYGHWRREGHSRHPWPVLFWIGFTSLISPTAYLRFDMLPAVLAGSALLLAARRRPGWAGALIGLGAATKLWPALLWFTLLGRRENRGRASLGFWGVGSGLALASLLWAGWDRLVSPLAWQSGRGLQVESVWATVPMLTKLFDNRYSITISRWQAFEIFGPGVADWLVVARVATGVGMVGLLALLVWWLASRTRDSLLLAGLLMVLASAMMIATNKTFSPQYLLWLGGPMAAVIALADAGEGPSLPGGRLADRGIVGLAWLLIAVTALTDIVYPLGYHNLVRGDGVLQALFTVVLIVRNVAFGVFVGALAVAVVRRVRAR